jgi:hypothetical protein
MTYTVARLAVNKSSYDDIKSRIDELNAYGNYDRMFIHGRDSIDMTNIAIEADSKTKLPEDVIRLVLAARNVLNAVEPDLYELDLATEAFADRVAFWPLPDANVSTSPQEQ